MVSPSGFLILNSDIQNNTLLLSLLAKTKEAYGKAQEQLFLASDDYNIRETLENARLPLHRLRG